MDARDATSQQVLTELLDIHAHYPNVQVEVQEAVLYARRLQAGAMRVIRSAAEEAVPPATSAGASSHSKPAAA
jgi:hypothetical protein